MATASRTSDRREEGADQGAAVQRTSQNQAPLLTDPCRDGPGGQVPEQLTDADQRDQQRRHTDRRSQDRADRATIGSTAPSPIEISIVGPYTGTMSRRHGTTPEAGGWWFRAIR